MFAVFDNAEKVDERRDHARARSGETQPRKTHVMLGGDCTRPARKCSRACPRCSITATATFSEASGNQHGSVGRRLALAHWIAEPDNPLTARVIVNRLWMYHFGRGLGEHAEQFRR